MVENRSVPCSLSEAEEKFRDLLINWQDISEYRNREWHCVEKKSWGILISWWKEWRRIRYWSHRSASVSIIITRRITSFLSTSMISVSNYTITDIWPLWMLPSRLDFQMKICLQNVEKNWCSFWMERQKCCAERWENRPWLPLTVRMRIYTLRSLPMTGFILRNQPVEDLHPEKLKIWGNIRKH